jgi:hypothetical protein
MVQRGGRSDNELLAVFILTIITGCLSLVTPTFDEVFVSYGAALPLPTRLVLAARPVYVLLFAGACLASVLLIAEGLGWDGGYGGRMRREASAILGGIAGRRAARVKALLLSGMMAGSALLLLVAVVSLLRP